MEIHSYLLSGISIANYDSYPIHSLQGNASYILSDQPVSGYINTNSIRLWHDQGKSLGKDYKFVREEIKQLVAASGWNNLNLTDKRIAAEIVIVPS